MTQQEYQHIKILAWYLLADAKISSLPVDIDSIAALYGLEEILNHNKSRYENTYVLSARILDIFGYNTEPEYIAFLVRRILAPIMGLKELKVNTPQDMTKYTEPPIWITQKYFAQYCSIVQRSMFGVSRLERKMMANFLEWLKNNKRQWK